MWNLGRLSGDAQKQFKKRFSSEYQKYIKENALERTYFDDKTWFKMLAIVHSYNPIYPILRTFIAIIAPIYKNRIRSGYNVRFLFNKFAVAKTKL